MIRFIPAALAILSLVALTGCEADGAPPAAAIADQSEIITILGFECGDNCYLNYRPASDPDGETDSAICTIGPCGDWFEEQAMPPEYTGRRATIRLGLGKQYDNDGNVMSENFPEITSLVIDPAQ